MKVLIKLVFVTFIFAMLFCSCSNSNSEITVNTEQTQESKELSNTENLHDSDIRNLKWGMSVDEAKANETATFFNEEYDLEQKRTLLNYSNVEYNGLIVEMTLNVSDTDGLNGVNYHIDGNYYQDLYNKGVEMYGKPDEQYDDGLKTAWWYAPTEKYQIFIMFYDNVTSYDYWSPEDFETTEQTQTTSIAVKKYCIVDGCYKEATKSIVGISGQTEYYCKQHYDELEDLVNNLLNSTNAPSGSSTIGEKNSLAKAKNYLDIMPFSYSGLVEQLEYEGYTHSEAVYGADNCGADWNEQAEKQAAKYLALMPFSRQELIEQLEYEGYTYSQAVHGAEANGY